MLILPETNRGRHHFMRILKEAVDDGTINGLVKMLHYLHTYADPDGMGEKQQVAIVPSFRDRDPYFDIYWKRPISKQQSIEVCYAQINGPATIVWETWMNGGLCRHGTEDADGNKWSVHT